MSSETTQCPFQCFLVFTVFFQKLFSYFSESKKEQFSVRDRLYHLDFVLCDYGQPWLEEVPWGSLVDWMGSEFLYRSPKGAGLPKPLSLRKTFTCHDPTFSQSSLVDFGPSAPASQLKPEAVRTALAVGCRTGCLYWLHISTWVSLPSNIIRFLVLMLSKAFVV